MRIEGESGEKTFVCKDCKGRKSYHAVRCRECHYIWARENPNLHYTKVDLTDEFRQKLREQFTPQSFSQDNTLNGLLNETAQSSHDIQQPQHNPHDPVNQFINKDYGPLMKAIEKKQNFRP